VNSNTGALSIVGGNKTIVVSDLTGPWNASAVNVSGNAGRGAAAKMRQSFVLGPEVPVLGKGSAQLQVPDNSDVAQSLRWRVPRCAGSSASARRG
jgi:hypothetical protein